MEVTNKEMYHFHHPEKFKEIWVSGNELVVDDNFESSFLKILNYYSSAVNTTSGRKREFNKIIERYLEEEQDKETYIKLLKEAKRIIYESNIFLREKALEEIREKEYPYLPSRKHSIWLCDEKCLDFWRTELIGENDERLDLYKVLVTGNLFKSSDAFIPENYYNYENMLASARKYWKPNFENEIQEATAEYLFQGKVKILEKIK